MKFVEGFGGRDFEVEAVGEEGGEGGVGTDGEETVGGKSEVRSPKSERIPKFEIRKSAVMSVEL